MFARRRRSWVGISLAWSLSAACSQPDASGEMTTTSTGDEEAGQIECDAGLDPCDGECVDLQTNTSYCGWCTNSCVGSVPASCIVGECVADCDAPLVGCGFECVVLDSDPAHCGACGRACPPGTTCDGGECQCAPEAVSFSTDVQPIFDASCATVNCHTPASRKGDLDLSAAVAWAETVNVGVNQCDSGILVSPGQVHGSYLLSKLLGVDMCQGARMPRQDDPLDDAEVAVIANWICQGALDD
jgi:hypothetical protein